MNAVLFLIKNLSKPKKILILVAVDIYLTFICWLIFGPAFSIVLAAGFDIKLSEVVFQNYINYIFPTLSVFAYFYFSEFYRTSIRFSDSRDSILRSLKGALIFGSCWGIVYLFQFEIIRNGYIFTVLLKSILLAFAFYGSLQISRDLARLIIHSDRERSQGKPILIYGAGTAGNELYHSIKNAKRRKAHISISNFKNKLN